MDELFDATGVHFGRGIARFAKSNSSNPRTLELLERTLSNRDMLNLKRRELDLVRHRLDQQPMSSTRIAMHPRRRLPIGIQSP